MIALAICVIVLVGIFLLVVTSLYDRFVGFESQWFCKKMGWHLAPKQQGFDGCSMNGCCPRCHKEVMQDSQGNWF